MPRHALALLICSIVGCQTAKDSFESAKQAEAAGRWTAAAEWYIDALRRDAEYPGARDGLVKAGAKAIAGYMKAAGSLERAGRHKEATAEYGRTDSLVTKAAGVSVALETPSGYTARRRATWDRVIEQTLAAADRLAAEGRWRDAEQAYRTAVSKYQPSQSHRKRALAGRIDALVAAAKQELTAGQYDEALALADRATGLADADPKRRATVIALRDRIAAERYRGLLVAAEESMKAGRYQEAFEKVEAALATQDSADAQVLRTRIIDLGTVMFVPTPVWRLERIARFVPQGMLATVNATLREEYWDKPPLFLATPGEQAVLRELRRFEIDQEILSERRAAAVGERLQGAFTVVTYLSKCGFVTAGDPEVRRVATRDGLGADILVYSRRGLEARCLYRLVRVEDSRVVDEGAVDAGAVRRVRHATYDGDMRDLLLAQDEHALFDPRRLRSVDRELEQEAVDKLAGSLAEAVYAELVKRLP